MKPKILVVDDDPNLLSLMSIRLNAEGYTVETVENAEKALVQLSISRPDLVVTDLRMDGMDGLALFDAIHQINPALPVIILTAHGTIPEAVAATKRGVYSFISKPFEGKELLEHIKKALRLSGETRHHELSRHDDDWRSEIISQSSIMEDLLTQARLVAQVDASILLHGPSGTGKELLAKAIHKASLRRNLPFVAINCSAIPEQLLESELFGHSKGSFTGATKDHIGLFQAAHGGTLFLDEVGDMPLLLQVKLLRVLQEKTVRPVGSTVSVPVDVRIISATHKDLTTEMTKGAFREDLYYRLNVVSIEMPPLSERREDIPLLVRHFLDILGRKNAKKMVMSPEAMELLVSVSWPGNVRQLLNVVEQVTALSVTPLISPSLVQRALNTTDTEILSFAEAKSRFEKDYLCRILQIAEGKVSQAARLAKRNRTEFYKLLHRHGLDPALFKSSRENHNS